MENGTRKLPFQKNWNSKLNCDIFTTIRSYPLAVGQEVEVQLKGQTQYIAVCLGSQQIGLSEIPDYVISTDTGYPAEKGREILRSFAGYDPKRTMYVLTIARSKKGLEEESLFGGSNE